VTLLIRDRRLEVILAPDWNGIDFVEIANPAQTVLRVHFLNLVPLEKLPQPTIIGGATIPTVVVAPVTAADWSVADGHRVLTLRVAAPGDFSQYTLKISDPVVDRYFEQVRFSFKAECPSEIDCEIPTPPCPPLDGTMPRIDYLAKDFLSFRQALLDFSALQYPDWQERSEADFGLMFLEALAGMADDLSYVQDRIAAEATLDTATQRRSVVRHARLVDYEPGPILSARVQLQFDVDDATTTLPAGLAVNATSPEGSPIVFELGDGLATRSIDPITGSPTVTYPVRAVWNRGRIQPYAWDASDACLRRGAKEMWVAGHGFGFTIGQALLIDTAAAVSADQPIRQIVHLSELPLETCDPLNLLPIPSPNGASGPPIPVCPGSIPGATRFPAAVTRLRWDAHEALTADHDLRRTVVVGNILTATQGRTITKERFAIPAPDAPPPSIPLATARLGPNSTAAQVIWQFLRTLDNTPLTWLAQTDRDAADSGPVPEILLYEDSTDPTASWTWRRRLLDADRFESSFTVDAAAWHPVATLPARSAGEHLRLVADYDGDAGDTIRFGDGSFGEIPADGATFVATYRIGVGSSGNVGANAIRNLGPQISGVIAVTNPLPATGGTDPEGLEQVRRRAPFAFRAPPPLRAVRPEDYRTIAETLPWVQRAGTAIRWTGSWLSTFTTPDPVGSETLDLGPHLQLVSLLNRRRMAGAESFVPPPHYVALDLLVEVCATAEAYRGGVLAAIVAALIAGPPPATAGFFGQQNFTFGTPLDRSRLEAAIKNVTGVAGVTCLQHRMRGRTQGYVEMPDVLTVGSDEIIRLDNDPNRPDNGSLRVSVLGGK
jgi:uncharacterized phage protein gp47/JayE